MADKGDKGAKKPSGGLGDLGRALREAGILSEDRAKKLAHEERVRKGQAGRDAIEAEKRAHEEEIAKIESARKADVQVAQVRHRTQADLERLARIVKESALPATRGGKRFHFVAKSGRVPFVDAGEDVTRQLVSGSAGIVEVPGKNGREHAIVADRASLEEIAGIDPDVVRFWNR
ncbi:MAG: DUF2058 family protein [Planctomycetes bacterium]|nr:DUF2058 family protein [Planctomycetota bacterium]